MEIAPGIHHIPGVYDGIAAFVTAIIPDRIDDPAGITLIDTGTASVPAESLAPYLAKHGRSLADVRRVLNSHGHLDHAGGNGPVKAASGAEIRIHQADRRMAEDPTYHYELSTARWLRLTGLDEATSGLRSLAYISQTMQAVPVDGTVADGEEVDCGPVRLQVIHTPGHTPGCVCYYWPEGRLLISGDSIQGAATRPGSLPRLLTPAQYVGSLKRLGQLDVETLLLSHYYRGLRGEGAAIRRGGDVKVLLDDSIEVARLMAEAVDAARGLPPVELVAAFVDRLRPVFDIPAGRIPSMAIQTALATVFPIGD